MCDLTSTEVTLDGSRYLVVSGGSPSPRVYVWVGGWVKDWMALDPHAEPNRPVIRAAVKLAADAGGLDV